MKAPIQEGDARDMSAARPGPDIVAFPLLVDHIPMMDRSLQYGNEAQEVSFGASLMDAPN